MKIKEYEGNLAWVEVLSFKDFVFSSFRVPKLAFLCCGDMFFAISEMRFSQTDLI